MGWVTPVPLPPVIPRPPVGGRTPAPQHRYRRSLPDRPAPGFSLVNLPPRLVGGLLPPPLAGSSSQLPPSTPPVTEVPTERLGMQEPKRFQHCLRSSSGLGSGPYFSGGYPLAPVTGTRGECGYFSRAPLRLALAACPWSPRTAPCPGHPVPAHPGRVSECIPPRPIRPLGQGCATNYQRPDLHL